MVGQFKPKNQELFNLAHALACNQLGIENSYRIDKKTRKLLNKVRRLEYNQLIENHTMYQFELNKGKKPMRNKSASRYSASIQFSARGGREPKNIIRRMRYNSNSNDE